MHFFTNFLLMATALVAAAPASHPAEKRDSISCGLTNYPGATKGPINDGIRYLQDKTIYMNYGQQGNRVSCSYGTGIWVSSDPTGSGPVTYAGSLIADDVARAYDTCNTGGGGNDIEAFQFWASGYNVLVTGGQDC